MAGRKGSGNIVDRNSRSTDNGRAAQYVRRGRHHVPSGLKIGEVLNRPPEKRRQIDRQKIVVQRPVLRNQ